MKFKAVPILIAASWLIPSWASAQLPPTVWSNKPAKNGSETAVTIKRPKPSVAPWDQPGYARDPRDVKDATTWEAPTRLDRQVAEEIEQTQIDYGPQDIRVALIMWKHAQNYFNSKEYSKAKDLLQKLLDMADPEIRAKMPMTKVQKMYADSATKMLPLARSTYKPFSHKSVSHSRTYQQYLNQPDVNKTQVGKGTFVYNKDSNTPLLSAASNQTNSRGSSVLVKGPNFSFRATGPTNIQLNGMSISIPAGATGVLNISNTPPRSGSGQSPGKLPVKYLRPGAATVVPSSGPAPSTVAPTRGPGNFDTGGFHDLDPGFTIHNN